MNDRTAHRLCGEQRGLPAHALATRRPPLVVPVVLVVLVVLVVPLALLAPSLPFDLARSWSASAWLHTQALITIPITPRVGWEAVCQVWV